MPRVRFTMRGLMVAVAVVAALIVAPDLLLGLPEPMLVATVVGTAALAIEKARREVERARHRGEKVGPLRFPGRFIARLPVAIIIVAVCRWFNDLSYVAQTNIAIRLVHAACPGLAPFEVYLALLRITPRMTAAMDLVLVWTAFRLWNGSAAAHFTGLPAAPVSPDLE